MAGGKVRARSMQAALSNGVAARNPRLGANGLGPERVVEIQRARLLAAMVEESVERGAGNVAVGHVVDRAGVSRRTFYEIFTDREDCFIAAFDDGVALASRYVLDGYDPHVRWAVRCRTALTRLLSFLTFERGMGQLLIVGSLGAGTSALKRRERVLAQMIALVDQGRLESKMGNDLPPLTAEGVVGGALSVLHARLVEDAQGPLIELAGPLMAMIVLPYLGPVAARREIARPVPKPVSLAGHGGGDPLRDLGMRLTYRTVRVLLAIAQAPGSSNRDIGIAAGIADQGQISKLLTRLHGLGLVQNTGQGPGTGTPNIWTLTQRGQAIQAMITEQGAHKN
jgi:AcrR family transcriptional regulator/DNA-binding MarR family transcriptional regulator